LTRGVDICSLAALSERWRNKEFRFARVMAKTPDVDFDFDDSENVCALESFGFTMWNKMGAKRRHLPPRNLE
jgi:hypothetical protein